VSTPTEPTNVVDLAEQRSARRPLSASEQAVADSLDEIRAEYVRTGDPMGVALCDLLRRALLS
jgi:hypothetical protein